MALFKKKTDQFISMLEEQATKAEEACATLCEYCKNPLEATGDKVKEIEHDADIVRRHLIKKLMKTFITPLDREDLFHLSGDIDNIIDYTWNTVKELRIYEIEPDEALSGMAQTLYEITVQMKVCVSNMETDFKKSNDAAVSVKKLENTLNKQFHKAQRDLFEQDDFKTIMKYRQVYSHMNHASDKADHAADVVLTILVKQ